MRRTSRTGTVPVFCALSLSLALGLSAPVARAADPGVPLGPSFAVGGLPVARAPDGRLVIAWTAGENVLAQRHAADGTPVGPALPVATVASGPNLRRALGPDVAVDAGGGFVVAWREADTRVPPGEPDRVRARRFGADGTALGPAIEVSGPRDGIRSLDLDVNDAGDFAVAWGERNGESVGVCVEGQGLCAFLDTATVRARRYGEGGTREGAVLRIDQASESAIGIGPVGLPLASNPLPEAPAVTLREDGGLVVAWQLSAVSELQTLRPGVYLRIVGAGGLMQARMRVATLETDSNTSGVRIASDAAGGLVLAWRDNGGSRSEPDRLHLALRGADGAALGAPLRVDDGSLPDLASPALAVDPAGNAVVTWTGRNLGLPSAQRVDTALGQRFASGGGRLGVNFALADDPQAGAVAGTVARDAQGNFAVTFNPEGETPARARLYAGP